MDRDRDFTLKWRLGARTCTLIAETAARFRADVAIAYGDERANAKSIFALMMLCPPSASRPTSAAPANQEDDGLRAGERLRISAIGADADEAWNAIAEILSAGALVDHCMEHGCSSLPCLIELNPQKLRYSCWRGHQWEVTRSH